MQETDIKVYKKECALEWAGHVFAQCDNVIYIHPFLGVIA